jgi:hypothetical protein
MSISTLYVDHLQLVIYLSEFVHYESRVKVRSLPQ